MATMPAGSGHSLAHPQPYALPSGTLLWHLHPAAFAPTAFNPKSANRFAALSAIPPRAMYYAGQSLEVAIWETLLRDVIADSDGTVALFEARIAGQRLATVRTTASIQMVDLSMPALRQHVGNSAELEEWQVLQRVFPYESTHIAAANLLLKLPSLGGVQWTSKQAGNGAALVFYDQPVTRMLEEIDDRSVTWSDVDKALMQARITRVPTDPTTLGALP